MTKSSEKNETTGSVSHSESIFAKGKRKVSLSMFSMKSLFTKKKSNLHDHDTTSRNSTNSSSKSGMSESSVSKERVKNDEIKSILSIKQSFNNAENDSKSTDIIKDSTKQDNRKLNEIEVKKKSVFGKKLSNKSFNFNNTCDEIIPFFRRLNTNSGASPFIQSIRSMIGTKSKLDSTYMIESNQIKKEELRGREQFKKLSSIKTEPIISLDRKNCDDNVNLDSTSVKSITLIGINNEDKCKPFPKMDPNGSVSSKMNFDENTLKVFKEREENLVKTFKNSKDIKSDFLKTDTFDNQKTKPKVNSYETEIKKSNEFHITNLPGRCHLSSWKKTTIKEKNEEPRVPKQHKALTEMTKASEPRSFKPYKNTNGMTKVEPGKVIGRSNFENVIKEAADIIQENPKVMTNRNLIIQPIPIYPKLTSTKEQAIITNKDSAKKNGQSSLANSGIYYSTTVEQFPMRAGNFMAMDYLDVETYCFGEAKFDNI
jgi:hypothetical protein